MKGFYRKFGKRASDIIASVIALLLLSPVLIITAILVRLKLGSPVFFKQERPGKNEELFTLLKFKTMSTEKDSDGVLLPDSQRLKPFGIKLRKTSLDELPELINILKGDMSFVGPRPLLKQYLPYYKKDERTRHDVRPGLTGLAQVKGRNNVPWDLRLGYDVEYVKNMSFLLDLKVLVKTVKKVINSEDVTVVDLAPMKDLDVERGSIDGHKINGT